MSNQQGHLPEVKELLKIGRYDDAERLLRDICVDSNVNAESWFLLGALSGMRSDAIGAECNFRKALSLDASLLQAKFNLGIALRDQGRFDEACLEFQELVTKQPQHADAFNALGYVYMRIENLDEAERCFRSALAVNNMFPDALTNLGNVLASRQRIEEAIEYHRRALIVAPTHEGAAINLGGALLILGRFEEAIVAFKQAIATNPENVDAYVQLGSTLNHMGNRKGAEQAFRQALQCSPEHDEARYFLAALGNGDRPQTAPSQYVSKLFDGYAETFDAELVGKLQYRIPEMLFGAVSAEIAERRDLDVLDLGCGTGLCGLLFKHFSRTLAGVDLSSKMLAKANSRAVYDELEAGELTAALHRRVGVLDVVLAADVFIYVGDLSSVFEAVAKALRIKGVFAFSVESARTEEDEGYVLRSTGRYAHAQSYIIQLAHRFKFDIASVEDLCIRMDDDQPVNGSIYVLRQSASSQMLVEDYSEHLIAVKDVVSRTPEATQVTAKRNYESFLAAIPLEVHRREEKLPAELKKMNAKPMVKLATIRKSVETLFSYAESYVACRKGCAFCCHQAVDISRLEAEYIQEKTGVKYTQVTKPSRRDPLGFSEKTPCPFLKHGSCSIYEHRPLICRIAVNLDSDPYWCEFENWHKPGGAVPKPSFRSIHTAYTDLNEKVGSIKADIRDFFPIVPD
ncbi:tetratricopeptide repeat protein [Sulfurirhabdus autotrophica]|uniref:Putative TPR repeat methyltransferase n=1 Tax=Sulfurirhabdus autotrophica TaxID=1706046 RepID=A0A4V2W1A6_9PROT|nr:tetratricopeptide repeat protein [Sulfurirhabdus autotrophica]TCV83399.1 putative TPR repeat methyltransferase [Sulfurirhabdus autotrophica]